MGGTMMNEVRLANLRIYLGQVLREQPADKDALVNAYVNKIAGISNMKRAHDEGAQKEQDLRDNKNLLHRVLARGNELVGATNGFLFGPKLTTSDAFFAPIIRIFVMLAPEGWTTEDVFKLYPNLRGY